MAGCDEEPTEAQKIDSYIRGVEDSYIVLEINDTDVLHKGKVEFLRSSIGNSGVYMGFNAYEFDCGKTYTSNAQSFVSIDMPSEEVYDEICEDCFKNN